MSYGVKTINEMYGMEGQKHGSKYKKMIDNPNHEKIARKLIDGKGKWGHGKGEQKTINKGRFNRRGVSMVLLHGLCYGSNQATMLGTGRRSNHSLCYTEGGQDYCGSSH